MRGKDSPFEEIGGAKEQMGYYTLLMPGCLCELQFPLVTDYLEMPTWLL